MDYYALNTARNEESLKCSDLSSAVLPRREKYHDLIRQENEIT